MKQNDVMLSVAKHPAAKRRDPHLHLHLSVKRSASSAGASVGRVGALPHMVPMDFREGDINVDFEKALAARCGKRAAILFGEIPE